MEDEKLNKKVQSCVEKFKHLKVNLTRGDVSENGEGIWATPCTAEDKNIYEKGSSGEKFCVHLCNDPISWNLSWGSKIIAITNGAKRAYSRLSDNPETHYDELRERIIKKKLIERDQG